MTPGGIRIELTPEQRDQLRRETGRDVTVLRVDVLEDREPPAVFGLPQPVTEADLRIVPEG